MTALKSTLTKTLLLAGIALLMLLFVGGALAAQEPIDVTVSIAPDSFSAPGEAEVSLRVTNVSGEDMQEAVTLYDPAGKVVAGFGDGGTALLKEGEFRSVKAAWNVTQDQLDAGEVVYTVRYGNTALKAAAPVKFTGESVKLTVSRTLSPEVVRTGGTASVVYELYNAGNVELTNIKVTEKIASKNPQTVSTLKVGEKKTLTFTAKMGSADLSSSAKITYKAKGDSKTLTMDVEQMAIPVAVKGLEITLTADKESVNIGETVTLTMTVTNKGNITYSDVTVSDEKLGEVFSGLSIPAGGSLIKDKVATVLEPSKYAFTVKLTDNTGMTNTMTTNSVPVSAYDPEKALKLTLLLTSETETIESMPANVIMTLVVTNTSNVDCKDVVIKHGQTEIYTIPEMKAGQSETLRRDYTLSQAGQFRFTATTKDTIGNEVSFDSNTLPITYAAPTSAPTKVPEVTIAPLVTLPPATYADVDETLRGARNTLYSVMWVLLIAFAACLALFIISTTIRLNKKRMSAQAYDHLELGARRDYTEPAQENPVEGADPGEEQPPVFTEQTEEFASQLPHEKLLKQADEDENAPSFDIPDPVPEDMLIKPEASEETASEELQTPDAERPKMPPETDGLGAYRMKREQETPQEAPVTQEASADEKPRRARRAAHKVERDEGEEE